MPFRLVPVLLLVPFLAAPHQEASQGKVRLFVFADRESTYQGVQQRATDLDQTVRDVRKSLKKSDRVELTDSAETADVRVRILGRRKTPEGALALGYALEAGTFKNESEFVFGEKSANTSREASGGADRVGGAQSQRRIGWNEVASYFGGSLEQFAKSNYERILAQRK
jgi:hypothetical protein